MDVEVEMKGCRARGSTELLELDAAEMLENVPDDVRDWVSDWLDEAMLEFLDWVELPGDEVDDGVVEMLDY